MCLSSVDFSLEKDPKTGEFFGYGYKALYEEDGKLTGTDHLGNFRKDRWLIAKALDRRIFPFIGSGIYTPGFHLFLDAEDAKKYDINGVVAKFKFRKVIAFGKNYVSGMSEQAPCVVAEEMKFVGLEN